MSTKDELKKLLQERAVTKGVEIKLASGQSSSVYVNCKGVTLHGPSLRVLSKVWVDELQSLNPKPSQIAGVSVGGDPIVAGVICEAADRAWELEGLLVRKEAKKHGLSAGKAVDGSEGSSQKPVYLLEDVVSTGGSSITAAQNLLNEGYSLKGIFCIVDRQMGGGERIQSELGLPLKSIFKVGELL